MIEMLMYRKNTRRRTSGLAPSVCKDHCGPEESMTMANSHWEGAPGQPGAELVHDVPLPSSAAPMRGTVSIIILERDTPRCNELKAELSNPGLPDFTTTPTPRSPT